MNTCHTRLCLLLRAV